MRRNILGQGRKGGWSAGVSNQSLASIPLNPNKIFPTKPMTNVLKPTTHLYKNTSLPEGHEGIYFPHTNQWDWFLLCWSIPALLTDLYTLLINSYLDNRFIPCWSSPALLIDSYPNIRFLLCWSIHILLINSGPANRFLPCWSIPALPIDSCLVDRFLQCWSIPTLLIDSWHIVRFLHCWSILIRVKAV